MDKFLYRCENVDICNGQKGEPNRMVLRENPISDTGESGQKVWREWADSIA